MVYAQSNKRLSVAAGLGLLTIRGVLLWVVVPLSLVIWIVILPIFNRRGIKLGQFLGWIDLNLCALIEHTILRPLISSPVEWVIMEKMSSITHRIGKLDAV